MTRRAFTIVEVLAALGLLTMLVGLMTSTMASMTHRSAWVHDRSERQLGASIAIDRLATALRTTMVEAPEAGAGIRGTESSITVLSRTSALRPGETPSDLASLTLRCDPSDRALDATWEDESHMLAHDAIARFRYHDGTAWRDTFDSRASGRLPGAVELSVWFTAPAEEQPANSAEPNQSDVADGEPAQPEYPERAPDRLRVIAVPDPAGEATP
ncbi:MAG: hypothetical protein DHS20C14_12770 [Phycisphaeraceae bacterium]|nr:MAG: hypothetical protein DHS20C14_12770 [Phycisphaeraceae bacterium]